MHSEELAHQESLRVIRKAIAAGQTKLSLTARGGLKAIPKEIADLSPTELSIRSTYSSEKEALDISALAALETLEVLKISGSVAVDLEQLNDAPKLRCLEFSTEAHVQNLRQLERCPAFPQCRVFWSRLSEPE
jgi:ethanolamine utilization protein EutA (predicted chaperonin)